MLRKIAVVLALTAAPAQAMSDMVCFEGTTFEDGKDHLRIVIAEEGSFEAFELGDDAGIFLTEPTLIGQAEMSDERIVLTSKITGGPANTPDLVMSVDRATGVLTSPFVPSDAKIKVRCVPYTPRE